jgi:hypothetical protein
MTKQKPMKNQPEEKQPRKKQFKIDDIVYRINEENGAIKIQTQTKVGNVIQTAIVFIPKICTHAQYSERIIELQSISYIQNTIK